MLLEQGIQLNSDSENDEEEETAQVVSQAKKSKKGGKKDTKSEMDESEILIEAGQKISETDAKGSL